MGSAADQPVTQVKSVVVSLQLRFMFVRCRLLAGALIRFSFIHAQCKVDIERAYSEM